MAVEDQLADLTAQVSALAVTATNIVNRTQGAADLADSATAAISAAATAVAANKAASDADAAATAADRTAVHSDAVAASTAAATATANMNNAAAFATAAAAAQAQAQTIANNSAASATAAAAAQAATQTIANNAAATATLAASTLVDINTAAAAVASDKTAVHADRVAADADAAATAADRTAVASDKTAAHNDRVAADADAASTATDRAAVSADKDAAHADRVAADSAATAAAASAATASGEADAATAQALIATTQAGNAAGSATTATTQASIAATQAGVATAQAGTATTKASDASTFAAAALGSYNNANALLSSASAYAIIAQQAAASASAVSGLSNLSAAARAVAMASDVSAVCIYDTTKDSDGGAWRDKVSSASWMNETLNTATRGAVAQFPAKALIVGRFNGYTAMSVTIYDLTDPTCPMWMVFNGWASGGSPASVRTLLWTKPTSIFAINGMVYIAGDGSNSSGQVAIDFTEAAHTARDQGLGTGVYTWSGGIVARNTAGGWSASGVTGTLAASSCNDVAATILPLTPPNPARCGLPNPTVAVGTNGGLSVIRWDGLVSNSASTLAYLSVAFDSYGNLWSLYNGGALYACSPATYQAASFNITALASFSLAQLLISSPSKITACGPGMVAVAGSTGLARIKLDPTNPANSLINIKTATYDTGWMVLGKTVLAMAESSADLSAIAGGTATDRSGAGNNPNVVGSVTRAQVASGADTAWYGNFSASNYFESAPSPDGSTGPYDFGTGDFEIEFFAMRTAVAADYGQVLSYGVPGGAVNTAQFQALFDSAGVGCYAAGTSFQQVGARAVAANQTVKVNILRRSNVLYIFQDGSLVVSKACSVSIGATGAVLRIGTGGSTGALNGGGGAQLAATACIGGLTVTKGYAPSFDLVAFKHADQKPRFAANAQTLLTGANVQGVAWCPDTEQLAAVNSTAGCDTFKGAVRVANDNSATGSANLFKGSALAASLTYSAASLGAKVSAFSSWGGEAWQLFDTTASTAHYWAGPSWTAAGSQAYGFTVPLRAAAQGWSLVWLTATICAWINLSTGAVGLTSGSPTVTVSALASGEWLVTIVGTPSAGAQNCYLQSAAVNAVQNYVGTGGAAIIFGKPMLTLGSTVPTAYVDGLSGSANAKAVAFANGKRAVVTAAGVDVNIPAADGLRAINDGQGAAKRAVYDPTTGRYYGRTTDATPTVILNIPIPEGKGGAFEVVVEGLQTGGTATERDMFVIEGSYSRDLGGNATVDATSRAIKQVTGTTAAVAAADTTNQTLKVTVTGKAATTLIWSAQVWTLDSGLASAA